jgi:hypothetical protein
MMGGRTVIGAIPWVGPAIADLVTTHKWSAGWIARAIDRRLQTSPPLRDITPRGDGPLAARARPAAA